MLNSKAIDETAHYEQTHLDLPSLHLQFCYIRLFKGKGVALTMYFMDIDFCIRDKCK